MKFRMVVLEFLFLKEDNLSTLRNVNSNTGQALSFTNESKDLRVEVNIKLVIVGVTNDKSSL